MLEQKINQAKADGLFPLIILNNGKSYTKETGLRKKPECWIHSHNELNKDNVKNIILKYYKNKNTDINGLSLLLGEKSGVFVLDVDDNHNENVKGTDTFKDVFGCSIDEIQCPQHETPSGGRHLFFKYDERFKKSRTNVFPGIDLLSNGYTTPVRGTTKKEGEYKAVPGHDDFSKIPYIPDDMAQIVLEAVKIRNSELTESHAVKFTSVIEKSTRNVTLFDHARYLAEYGLDREQLLYYVNALNSAYCHPPLPESEVESTINSVVRHNSELDRCYTKEGVLIQSKLIKYLLPKCYPHGNTVMYFDENQGYYLPLSDKDVSSLWMGFIREDKTDDKHTKANAFMETFKLHLRNEYLGFEGFSDEKNYICFNNGVLDLKDFTLKEHSPKYHLTAKVKYDYEPFDPEKLKGSRLDKYLQCVDDETRLMLQETVGLVLSPHAEEVSKIIILYGDGQNGKSVFFSLLENMFYAQDKAVANMRVKRFGERFGGHEIQGKFVNLVPDDQFNEGEEILSGIFKSLISGEAVSIEDKGKPVVRVRFNMTHVIGVNTLPVSSDKTHGFLRRICIIPFNKRFGDPDEVEIYPDYFTGGVRDSTLQNDIKSSEEEMKLFISWGVEGLKRLQENNFVMTVSKESEETTRFFKSKVTSLNAFFRDRVQVVDKESFIPSETLYTQYEIYCGEKDLRLDEKANTNNRFTRQTKEYYKGNKEVRYSKCGKTAYQNKMGFYGLALKEEDEKEVD